MKTGIVTTVGLLIYNPQTQKYEKKHVDALMKEMTIQVEILKESNVIMTSRQLLPLEQGEVNNYQEFLEHPQNTFDLLVFDCTFGYEVGLGADILGILNSQTLLVVCNPINDTVERFEDNQEYVQLKKEQEELNAFCKKNHIPFKEYGRDIRLGSLIFNQLLHLGLDPEQKQKTLRLAGDDEE